MVYIFVKNSQVAVHQRNYSLGGYSTEKDHLCSHHQHYFDRSPGYYLNKAKYKGDNFYQLIQEVFAQNRHPEQLYRTCDGYFSLQRKTEPDKFSRACAIALEYGNYSYHFLSNIIKNNMTDSQETKTEQNLPKHKNIRGKEYYEQLKLKF
jgi:hypothetical protein